MRKTYMFIGGVLDGRRIAVDELTHTFIAPRKPPFKVTEPADLTQPIVHDFYYLREPYDGLAFFALEDMTTLHCFQRLLENYAPL